MKKLIFSGLFAIISFFALSQSTYTYDLKSPYTATSDTVVNGATAFLTSPVITYVGLGIVAVQLEVIEISGTTGGTITLQGSLDDTGDDFSALLAGETSTAIPTKTATDVTTTQTFLFKVLNSHCRRYRLSYTGTGTMSARFFGKILIR